MPPMLLATAAALIATAMTPATVDQPGQAETCTNHGVIAFVGSYRCSEPCHNKGVVVWAGESCFNDGAAGACYWRVCVTEGGVEVPET